MKRIQSHSFIHSNFNYYNSLFYNLPKYLIYKLKRIQNGSARIIKHKNKYEHHTSVLKDSHWLPIEQRSIFKITALTYKTLHGDTSKYLIDIIYIS